jgi:hypothetical protein
MRKNAVWLMTVVILAEAMVGIWKLVKYKPFKPISAVLVGQDETIKLSPTEAMNSRQLIPVLPGKNTVGPNDALGAMKTVNEVQEINRVNKENAK